LKRPEAPTFFLDRSLGKNLVAEALRTAGVQVEVHDDHFAPDAKDEDWRARSRRQRMDSAYKGQAVSKPVAGNNSNREIQHPRVQTNCGQRSRPGNGYDICEYDSQDHPGCNWQFGTLYRNGIQKRKGVNRIDCH
jgi:hypothetical protein